MKKRILLWLVVVPVVAAMASLLIPSNRYFLVGLFRHEPFHEGRPLTYWIDQLRAGNSDQRAQAATALGVMGPEARLAVPALATALRDETNTVRLQAALALFKIGPESRPAVPALAEALRDPEPAIRFEAALALHQLGSEAVEAVPALIHALRDPANRQLHPRLYRSVAQLAAGTLGRIGPPAREAIAALAEVRYDPASDEFLQRQAEEALKRIDH
jgi:HEAT repeat protein